MSHSDEARPMSEGRARLLMYGELASWWPLLSAPEDYAEEASHYTAVLKEHCLVAPRTLLELGSGGGNNASHMKSAFGHVTLVDLSPDMLAVSRSLNPECDHHVGDMSNFKVSADGTANVTISDAAATLGSDASSLFSNGGTALMIHAAADDMKTDPAGNAGARIACGVVVK